MSISHVITFYTEDQQYWLVKLINEGFAPLMNAARKSPDHFKRYEGSFRFWSFELMNWTKDYDKVDISISEPDNYKTDWQQVYRYFTGTDFELSLLKPVKVKAQNNYNCEPEKIDDKYFYEERVVDDKFFGEIRKPGADKPYTIVIENWHPSKMIYMFSSICSVTSFGVIYPKDRNFIVSLWKWKNMEGDFDLQSLVNNHVEAVKSKIVHQPLVYRKSIGEVIDQYTSWELGSKRKLNR